MHQLARTRRSAVLLLTLTSTVAFSADLITPPTIISTIPDVTSVALEWNESPAMRGKTNYTVIYCQDINFNGMCSDPVTGKSTKKLKVTQDNLAASTTYYFRIRAVDNGGNSAISVWSAAVTTLGGGDPPGDGCDYPGFSDPPGSNGLVDFIPPEWLTQNPMLVFADEFDGQNPDPWFIDDMSDPLNQAGNPDITEAGARESGAKPVGKRWSAWYNDDDKWPDTIGNYSSTSTSITGIHTVSGVGRLGDSYMRLGGVWESGPGVEDLTRPGSPPWDTTKLHTAFLKTWAREQIPTNGPYSKKSPTVKSGHGQCTWKPWSILSI